MAVTVRPTELVAAEELRTEEKQRLLGVIPNFYTSYIYDAAPLTVKQKFSLAVRNGVDPAAFIGIGIVCPASHRRPMPMPGTGKVPRDIANVMPHGLPMDAVATS